MIDKKTLDLCLANKERGYSALYNASISYVYWIINRYIQEQHTVKDLAQEIYANTFKNLKQFDASKGSFNTWLRRITVNVCLNHLRDNKKIQFLVPLTDDTPSSYSTEINLDHLEREQMEILLSEMPVGYRTVFLLVAIDGFNHEEAATSLGISKQTSRSQLARAKKWLQKRFTTNPSNFLYGTF